MSVITNYWPDPRFVDADNFALKNCSMEALPANTMLRLAFKVKTQTG
ncbi:hypothetical protein LMY38_01985 [Bifidobacterium longum]|nr:hypothetical protein [Bifidobacterium longum]UNU71441.1 hypothetical protein LMY38_01985 [Bifidobacterium longum]